MANTLGSGQSNTKENSEQKVQTARLNKPWSISKEGITFMAVWESGIYNGINWAKHKVTEGMILTVYDDGYGLPTVGMGHLVLPEDKLKLGETISLDRARALAKKDLAIVEKPLNEKIKVPLHQYEYDALVSILFNTGIYKRGSEKINRIDVFANMLNQGKYVEIPDFIKTFVAKRVPYRRVTEAKLFKDGIYDAKH